jgi:adenosylcobinamide-GDP ribazoletransferase
MTKRSSGFKSALSFLTIITVNAVNESDNGIASFTLVGFIVGLISAILFYITYTFIDPLLASAVAVSSLMLLSGFNHVDAVLDTGDAIMVRGTKERKREVIKDKYIGAGGVGSFFIIYLVLFAALPGLGSINGSISLVVVETASKFIMVYSLHHAKVFSAGFALHFRDQLDSKFLRNITLNIIPLFLLLFFSFPLTIIPFAISFIIIIAVGRRINSLMEGINGDIIGFMGELYRTIATVGILIEIKLFPLFSLTLIHFFMAQIGLH